MSERGRALSQVVQALYCKHPPSAVPLPCTPLRRRGTTSWEGPISLSPSLVAPPPSFFVHASHLALYPDTYFLRPCLPSPESNVLGSSLRVCAGVSNRLFLSSQCKLVVNAIVALVSSMPSETPARDLFASREPTYTHRSHNYCS